MFEGTFPIAIRVGMGSSAIGYRTLMEGGMATRVGLRFSSDCFRLVCGLLGVSVLGLAGCGGSGPGGPTITQPQVTVSGASQVRLGSTAQFTATVTGETNTAVTWQVNGVNGGAAVTGGGSAARRCR